MRALLGVAPSIPTSEVRWQDLLAQNTSTMPTNGWYLPSANTLGVATNGVQRGLIGSTGGWQIGAPTGGDKGAGNVNVAGGYFVNGVAISNASGANPSASIGLSAVNGTATTFMRSDAAPALSQAITPTMTGVWTFTAGLNITNASASTSYWSGVSGYPVLTLVGGTPGTSSVTDLAVNRAGSTANAVQQGPNITLYDSLNSVSSCWQQSGGQTEFWQNVGNAWTQVLKFTSTRVTINTPLTAASVTAPMALCAGSNTNYTVQASDSGSIFVNGTSAKTVTLPVLPVGTFITFVNTYGSSGSLTLAAGSGVALAGTTSMAAGSVLVAYCFASGYWFTK